MRGFDAEVRTDALLAPIFEARIRDWEPYLAQMGDKLDRREALGFRDGRRST